MFGSPAKLVKHERISIIEGIAPSLNGILNIKKDSLFSKDSREIKNDDLANPEQIEEQATTVTVMCGRIAFAGIVVPPDAPKDLICEECEKSFAVFCCLACKQVQCERCADLVHPRDYGGAVLHPHETNERIRPVQRGDTSKIVLDTSFQMPDTELCEEDLTKVRDLSVPNSLSTNPVRAAPTSATYSKPCKYKVNEIMLFKDPHSGADVYGRILSEWDHRHSAAAPSIIRGNDSVVYYMVQMLGPIPHMGKIERLEKLCNPKAEHKTREGCFASLEGAEVDLHNEVMVGAHRVNKRVQEMRNIQILGPKYHLRQIGKAGVPAEQEEDDMYSVQHSAALDSIRSSSQQLSSKRRNAAYRRGEADTDDSSTVASDLLSIGAYMEARRTDHGPTQANATKNTSGPVFNTSKSVPQLIHSLRESETDELAKEYALASKSLYAQQSPTDRLTATDKLMLSQVNVHSYADVDTDLHSQLSHTNANNVPFPAVLRSYEDVINKQLASSAKKHDAYYSADHQKVVQGRNILVIGEADLLHLEDHIAKLKARKNEILRRVLQCSVFSTDMMQKAKKFYRWKEGMQYLKRRQQHFAMVRIQSRARVWLCRNKIAEKTAQWHTTLEERRVAVHAQFRRSDPSDRYAVTMDNKKYFKTLADLNRYAAFLRLVLTRIVTFQTRKRHILLRKSLSHWRVAVGAYLEENLVVSHFNDEASEDRRNSRGVKQKRFESLQSELESIAEAHLQLMDGELSGRRMDELGYDTVVTLPLKPKEHPSSPVKRGFVDTGGTETQKLLLLKDATSEALIETAAANNGLTVSAVYEEVVPSYIPSEGISLPPLIEIFDPQSAEGRLGVTRERRLEHCSFRAEMEGPTFESCWVVPGRLSMGSIPVGPAAGLSNAVSRSKNQVSAVSALMLVGVDLFVSLLPPEEEERLETHFQAQSVSSMTVSAFDSTRAAVNQILIDNTGVIAKQQAQIDAIPKFGKSDPRYPAAYREALRCKARIKLAQECMKRTQDQVKKLAHRIDWMQIPIERDSVPGVNAILPLLWTLERKLREGRNIYLYSSDGHGRAGLMSALLLGRLYGLHPYEALYRIQSSHDCSKREEHRHIPINCPQLPVQRQLVTDVLGLANRVLENFSIRSQVDPETFVDHHRPRAVLCDTTHNQADDQSLRGDESSEGGSLAGSISGSSATRGKQPQQFKILPPVEEDSQFPAGTVRTKHSLYFEHHLPPIERKTPSLEHARATAHLLNEPEVAEMYSEMQLGQSRDVVRNVPQRRPAPALQPTLPLLRQKDTHQSSVVTVSKTKMEAVQLKPNPAHLLTVADHQ